MELLTQHNQWDGGGQSCEGDGLWQHVDGSAGVVCCVLSLQVIKAQHTHYHKLPK